MRSAAFILTAAAIVATAPAAATDFSFVGTFAADDGVAAFDFTVASASEVTLRTYSYAGGTNAAGTVIARGGFDPILSLYDTVTGDRIDRNDDGGTDVPADAVTGLTYDTFLKRMLGAGTYRVFVTQYDNFGPDNYLTGTFRNVGDATFTAKFACSAGRFCDTSGDNRDARWAFDVLGVATAAGPAPSVPEPASWALTIGGAGLVGGALRRRPRVAASVRFA